MLDIYTMKPVTLILLVILLFFSTSTTSVGRESDSHPQTPSVRPARQGNPFSVRSLVSNPTRSLRGGSSPDPAVNFWDRFSDIPARSLWGGFPLNTVMTKSAQSSFAQPPSATFSLPPSCQTPIGFCITPHQFPFQRPFSSVFNTVVESSYLYGTTEFGSLAPHHGVEILNPTGTPILAVEDGTVVVAGTDAHQEYGPWENFYGNLVVLEHRLPGMDEPVYTLYGHLSTINVRVRQEVKAGELLGEVGTSGRAMGSHLHFEVRVGKNLYMNTRNPALWLLPGKGENGEQYGALAGKLVNDQGDPIYKTINMEYYADINGPPDKPFYIETYATDIEPIKSNDIYQENFVLTDLPPGHYRITLSSSGKFMERWVEIEAGKLSFVTIETN